MENRSKNQLEINSVAQCTQVVRDILNKRYDEPMINYAIYVSVDYFVHHIDLFSNEDVELILNSKELVKKINPRLADKIINYSIEKSQILTYYDKTWFKNSNRDELLLKKYLKLLLSSDDLKQIEFFCSANPKLSREVYVDLRSSLTESPQSYVFEKFVVINNPSNINLIITKFLTENDFLDMFTKKILSYDDLSVKMLNFSRSNQWVIVKDKVDYIKDLFSNIENSETKSVDIENIVSLVSTNPVLFFNELNKIDNNFLFNLFSYEGTTKNDIVVNGKIFTSTTINMLQSIVERMPINIFNSDGFKKWFEILLTDYKDILLEDVVEKIGVMSVNFTENYLHYIYKNQFFYMFKSLAEGNENLNIKEQETVLKGFLEGFNEGTSFCNSKELIKILSLFSHEKLEESVIFCKNNAILSEMVDDISKVALNNKLVVGLDNKQKVKSHKI